jgi:hypothetical protein
MNSPSKNRNLQGSAQERVFGLVRPSSEKGRMLYVSDVIELLRNGKSAWWVRNHFAPEHRLKVGRSPAWWESDALDWLNRQGQR